jgi:uncharacterized protein (TIGR03118 family)
MSFPSFFQKSRAAPDRQCAHRLHLECLESRWLLSGGFAQVDLASDVPGLASIIDPNLVNPWGIAFSPTGPFWFADNGSGVSDILDGRGQPFSLVVPVPSAARRGSTPTGTVFNGGAGFVIAANGVAAPSRFLFATEDGTISGWTAVVDPTRALLAVDHSSAGSVYKGLALATDSAGRRFLYAADFGRAAIDVFNQDFQPVVHPGSFRDPDIPDGFAPFNVQNINNLLFVTYAQQDKARRDDIAGAGHGFIDVYDTGGNLVSRFASHGALNSPWGLALAPASFGPFGGALLVGNNGDGRINAYDLGSGAFLGPLADDNGVPITVPTLWALTFGNGHEGGASDTLFFTAGVDYEDHGLFGAIQAPQRRGTDTAGTGTFDPHAPGEPGDYPLPPRGGPALRDSNGVTGAPNAVLLPLRESSLAVIPTLPTTSKPATGVSFNGPVLTAVPASNTIILFPADGNSQPARGRHHSDALNTFLDLDASANASEKEARGQRPGTNPDGVGAHSSPSTGHDARGEGLLAEAHAEWLEAQSSQERSPGELLPSDQAYEVLTAAPLEIHAESADQRAVGNQSMEIQHDGGWTIMIDLLFVASLPLIWTYWLAHEMKSRRSSGGTCRK